MTDPVDAAVKAILSARGDICGPNCSDCFEDVAPRGVDQIRRDLNAALPILRAHHFQEAAHRLDRQANQAALTGDLTQELAMLMAANFLRGLAEEPYKRTP